MIETLIGTLFGGIFRMAPEALLALIRKFEGPSPQALPLPGRRADHRLRPHRAGRAHGHAANQRTRGRGDDAAGRRGVSPPSRHLRQ